MGGTGSLPVGWLTLLDNPQGCRPYIEINIDPSGENFTINAENGLIGISDIVSGIDIDPSYSSQLILKDIQLSFADPNQLYSMFVVRTDAFRVIQRIIDEASTNNPCDLRAGLGEFEIGDKVWFTDGDNLESVTLTSASTNQIGWGGALSNTYAEGSMVSTFPLMGKQCNVILKLDGNANSLTIFKGIIKEPFQWDGKRGTLKVTNLLVDVLDTQLEIISGLSNTTDYLNSNGSFTTSFRWSSGATTSLSSLTTYAGCPIGEWEIVIGSGSGSTYNFILTDPDGNEYPGSTGSNFFTHTDATDSFLQIPSANWGGTIATGDTLIFRTAINYQDKTVPEIVYDLLVNYTTLTSSDIDVGGTGVTDGTALTYSFNKLYDLVSSNSFNMTFDQPCTVIEAILSVLPHELAHIGQMLNGDIRIFAFHPDFYLSSLTPRVIGSPQISKTELYNAIKIWYKWSHANGADEYIGACYDFPESDIENPSYKLTGKKRFVDIYCPGYVN